ncbi:MAG: response regulator [Xanthobacteraceae bacterium]|jgi:two-component system, chemotaxis family, chemotaxis protein CheY
MATSMLLPDHVGYPAIAGFNAGPEPSDDRRSSVLVIEDAIIHSNIISRIAGKVGFAATGARSYEEACKLLSARQFDCITLDLGLGQRAGFDVLRYLSAAHCRAWIAVISQADRDVCDDMVQLGRALDLNVYIFVQKPIDVALLRETLEHMRVQSVLEKFGPAQA